MSKIISINDFDDGFTISTVYGGWREMPQGTGTGFELGVADSYMACESGVCENGSPFHFPPSWEEYAAHEAAHPREPIIISDELWEKLISESDREKEVPNMQMIIKRLRDEAAQ